MTGATVRVGNEHVAVAAFEAIGYRDFTARHRVVDLGALAHEPDDGCLTTLIVPAHPLPCRMAVEAVNAGLAEGAVTEDCVTMLGTVLDAVEAGVVAVSAAVREAARAAPRLSDRQLAVLGLVVAGAPNTEIARRLHMSVGTTKREVSALLIACGVPRRAGLVVAARRLGSSATETPDDADLTHDAAAHRRRSRYAQVAG